MPPKRSSLDVWVQLDMGCHVIVPVNCELKRNGALVMGAGLAKALVDRYQALPGVFGLLFSGAGPGVYRATCSLNDGSAVGSFISFPTKRLWREPADYKLLARSLRELVQLADKDKLSGIYVPKVGCGLGGLDWNVVSELLEHVLDGRFIVPAKPE